MNFFVELLHNRGKIIICTSLCLLMAGCAREIIVEKPVPVPYETVIYKPIPPDLLIRHQKSTLPAEPLYGEGLQLCASDRANLDSCNAQLESIQGLSSNE